MNNETETGDIAKNQPEDATGIRSVDDEDFGDFGGFEEILSRPMDEHCAEQVVQGQNHPEPASGTISLDDDDFGDFGNFEEVPDEPVNQNDTAQYSAAGVSKQIHEDPDKQPEMTTNIGSLNDDDFGDFEEVSSTNSTQLQEGVNSESSTMDVPTPRVTLLNESVRAMFQTVFAVDGQVQLDLDREERAKLPFDVTLRSVLANESSVEETTDESFTHSAQGLAKIKSFLKGLPVSPPIAILSHDKWYPYSHYIFSSDGTPMVECCAPVSPTPSVPDVLCINLPTGFDASEFNNSNKQLAEVSFSHQKPSDADLPVKNNDHEDRKPKSLFDEPQLSPAGKKFLDQIPNLSYMLSSSLHLPGNSVKN